MRILSPQQRVPCSASQSISHRQPAKHSSGRELLPHFKTAHRASTIAPVFCSLPVCLFILFFCGSIPSSIAWKCKGCSALQCKPSGSCSALDGDTQPHAAPWFFYSDLVVQEAWAACASASASCPLIQLPCGHSHYTGARTPAKYDVAVSCESNGIQCLIALPLSYHTSSSLSRTLQLSLTPSNAWMQVAGNASCGAVGAQLQCKGNGRLWLRGGMYTGQEQAWVGIASYRCISCDTSVASWMPTADASPALRNQSEPANQSRHPFHDSPSGSPPKTNNDSMHFAPQPDTHSDIGTISAWRCLPLSACLAVGQTASRMLLAVATACADEDCHRYILISASSAKSPLATHIFSFASIERAVISRLDAELHVFMRSGPPLKLALPLSNCIFAHHFLLELQQHLVLIDDIVTATLNASCSARAAPVLRGDSVCVREEDFAAATHMATAWHDHMLHLQIVSGSHISQEDAEAEQLKLQIQARASLCANFTECDVTCLSCDGAFIAATPTRIVVAKLPLDRPVSAHLLSHVSSVDTMADGLVRLFLAPDGFSDTDERHVSGRTSSLLTSNPHENLFVCLQLHSKFTPFFICEFSHVDISDRFTVATMRTRRGGAVSAYVDCFIGRESGGIPSCRCASLAEFRQKRQCQYACSYEPQRVLGAAASTLAAVTPFFCRSGVQRRGCRFVVSRRRHRSFDGAARLQRSGT